MTQFFEMSNALGGWLVTHLPKMSLELLVFALVVYASIRLLRIKSPAVRHLFWCLVLLKPVVTLLIASPLSLYSILPSRPMPLDLPAKPLSVIEQVDIIETDSFVEKAYSVEPLSIVTSDSSMLVTPLPAWQVINRNGIIALIWMTGSILLAFRLILGFAYVSFLRQSAELQQTGKLANALVTVSKTLNTKRGVRIAVSNVAHGPVIAGIIRPVILLPRKLANLLSPDQIKHIIAHELAHVRRWDNLSLLFQRVVETFMFFHPVVWFCGWIMRRDAEQACDNLVLSAYEDSARYADSLTRVAEWNFGFTKRLLVNTFAAAESNLAGRIRQILSGQRAKMTLGLSLASAIVLVIVGCLGLPTASMREVVDGEENEEISEATPVVDTTSINWQTIYKSSFNKEDFAKYKQVHTDRGLKISPHRNSLRIHGKTTDTWWTGEDATIAIDDMSREIVEVSVDFKVFNTNSYHLPLIDIQAESGGFRLFYQGSGNRGSYTARFQFLPFPFEIIKGKLQTEGYGSETEEFHNMRMLYDKRNACVSYYVDDQLLASGKLLASVGNVKSVMLGIETPNKGDDIDLRFKNLRVRVSDVLYSPSRDAVWKTIALAEFEDPSNKGVDIINQKGSGLSSFVKYRAGHTRGTSKSDDAYSAFKMKVVGDTRMHSDAYGDASTSSTSSGKADLSFSVILSNDMKLELRRTMGAMLSNGCRIVTDGINSPFKVVEGALFHRGNYGGAHGRMRISIDREAKRISYYAATSLLCVLQMQEQPVQIKEVLLEIRLSKKGTKVAARFDNLTVRSLGRLADVAEASFAEKGDEEVAEESIGIKEEVKQAVLTISTCAETDPRVKQSLLSLQDLDQNIVIKELVSFLGSEKNTIRRSAIYILWNGELEDITPAVSTLQKLCSHEEEYTRGMAALALGANKIESSFDILSKMTTDDTSAYARRCGAYALGQLGLSKAEPVLKQALEDSDFNVRNNAEAALTMLEQAKSKGQAMDGGSEKRDNEKSRITANLSNIDYGNIVLNKKAEKLFEKMNIDSPDIAKAARYLLQNYTRVNSDIASRLVSELMSDGRTEVKRAAIDLLECNSPNVRLYIIRQLSRIGSEEEYFLQKIVRLWDHLWKKEKVSLSYILPVVLARNTDNPRIRDLVEQLITMMIVHKGKIVPLAGIKLSKISEPISKEIASALRKQTDNEIYDIFENVHLVRKAAMEALGEVYTPPEQDKIDYSKISIAKNQSLKKSKDLTVGVLTSLYTATGPTSSGGRDGYGWNNQCELIGVMSKEKINTLVYCHPVTEAEKLQPGKRAKKFELKSPVLNSANIDDLLLCDVVILKGVYNIQPEVVDALEAFVWSGGGIISIDGAGIIRCSSSAKLAALQDMADLRWAWRGGGLDETYKESNSTSITKGLNLSIPLRAYYGVFNKNGYTFRNREYADQVLLRFNKKGDAALRIGSYGKGRIAHIAWTAGYRNDDAGKREKELLNRLILWASGRKYQELQVKPAFSKERYGSQNIVQSSATHPWVVRTTPATSHDKLSIMLSHVDDTSEGKRSIAASGHAVLFERPKERKFIDSVDIFASRYGYPKPPDEDFHVYILNEKKEVLANQKYPYSMIERGDMRWYNLKMPAIEVPEKFYVALSFNPHRTKGIYLGFDKDIKKSHSFTGLPDSGYEKATENYDWMIRVYLGTK